MGGWSVPDRAPFVTEVEPAPTAGVVVGSAPAGGAATPGGHDLGGVG